MRTSDGNSYTRYRTGCWAGLCIAIVFGMAVACSGVHNRKSSPTSVATGDTDPPSSVARAVTEGRGPADVAVIGDSITHRMEATLDAS